MVIRSYCVFNNISFLLCFLLLKFTKFYQLEYYFRYNLGRNELSIWYHLVSSTSSENIDDYLLMREGCHISFGWNSQLKKNYLPTKFAYHFIQNQSFGNLQSKKRQENIWNLGIVIWNKSQQNIVDVIDLLWHYFYGS